MTKIYLIFVLDRCNVLPFEENAFYMHIFGYLQLIIIKEYL